MNERTTPTDAVLRHIREGEPAARQWWKELVQIQSPSSDPISCARALDWLAPRVEELGASVERIGPDASVRGHDGADATDAMAVGAAGVLVARGRLGGTAADARGTLLLCVHVDTVHSAWTGPVWDERDGVVRGPGVADMKGGVAVALLALTALQRAGASLRWTLIATTDEETGSWTSRGTIARLAPGHTAAFVPEPAMADGNAVAARPGSAVVSIRATGRAAHAGRDFTLGVNAVRAMSEALVAACDLSAPPNRLVNMALVSGGQAANIVPDEACARGNARWQTELDGDALERGLRALGRGSPDALPFVRIDFEANRPLKDRTPEVDDLVDAMARSARLLGLTIGAGYTGGVSDGNIVQSAGVPTLDGMGVRGGHLHRPDEFAHIDSLGERAAVLALTMLEVAG